MGLFNKKPHGPTPAEEAARRRGISHLPDDDVANRAQAQADARAARPSIPIHTPPYETKTLSLPQIDILRGRTNVEKVLAPYVRDGWEVISQDIKKYGVGGRHTIVLRRARP